MHLGVIESMQIPLRGATQPSDTLYGVFKPLLQANLTGIEAGGEMIWVYFLELRLALAAGVFGIKAPRMKAAARRGINGAGDISF